MYRVNVLSNACGSYTAQIKQSKLHLWAKLCEEIYVPKRVRFDRGELVDSWLTQTCLYGGRIRVKQWILHRIMLIYSCGGIYLSPFV